MIKYIKIWSLLFLLVSGGILLNSCGGEEKDVPEGPKVPPKEEDLDFGDDIMGDLDLAYDSTEAAKWRKEKDSYLKRDSDSPIPASVKKMFKGLTYYPIQEKYAVKAILNRLEKQDTVKLMTSKGTPRIMIKYGRFDFEIDGSKHSLFAFIPADAAEAPEQLFVPFTDLTNASETYKNGRYMDIDIIEGDNYILDFNIAYSPYCAYSDKYTCPIPPKENKLNAEIKAGEKNFAVSK